MAVEVNTDSQGISEKLSEVFYTVYTEDDILRVPVNWETESVNMRQCGVYTIRGSLKLPEGYEVGEMEIPQVQTTVSVQRAGQSGYQYLLQADGSGDLYFSMAGEHRCRFHGSLSEKGFGTVDESDGGRICLLR